MDRLSGDDGTGDIPRAPLSRKKQNKMRGGKGGRGKNVHGSAIRDGGTKTCTVQRI
jgi:hypothetical protein